ncbi:MAG: hypothetical protein U9O87_08190 [Verrucomicrobiota bacterium]|nr:hypothetical protein [Verrucomicrobiota bacterium]
MYIQKAFGTGIRSGHLRASRDCKKISDKGLKKQALKYGTGGVNNFFQYQEKDGSLPILLNDTDPDCFDCHQSADIKMAKPVFAQFCNLRAENKNNLSANFVDK